MSGFFSGERVAARSVGEDGRAHVLWKERVVRCRDCRFRKDALRGAVCTLRGEAGWFETGDDDFCSKGERP